MAGRLGRRPGEAVNDVSRVQIYNGLVPSGFAQIGTRLALGLPDDHLHAANAKCQRRRDETLRQLDGLPTVRPAGTWSLLLDVASLGHDCVEASDLQRAPRTAGAARRKGPRRARRGPPGLTFRYGRAPKWDGRHRSLRRPRGALRSSDSLERGSRTHTCDCDPGAGLPRKRTIGTQRDGAFMEPRNLGRLAREAGYAEIAPLPRGRPTSRPHTRHCASARRSGLPLRARPHRLLSGIPVAPGRVVRFVQDPPDRERPVSGLRNSTEPRSTDEIRASVRS